MTDLEPRHKFRWDLTINVPTVLTLVIAALSSALWIARLYADLDTRINSNATNNTSIRKDIDRMESAAIEQRRDQVQKIDALRSEVRGDLRDVGQKLDTLLLRGTGNR